MTEEEKYYIIWLEGKYFRQTNDKGVVITFTLCKSYSIGRRESDIGIVIQWVMDGELYNTHYNMGEVLKNIKKGDWILND